MPTPREVLPCLAAIPSVQAMANVALKDYARFGIGGPADVLAESKDEAAFLEALRIVRASGCGFMVLGGGTNLIVSDEGYRGIILRYRGDLIERRGNEVHAGAGAVLQALVDF